MNIIVSTMLNFYGEKDELTSLVADMADVLIKYNLVNAQDEDQTLKSAILVKGIDSTFDLDSEIESSFFIVIPSEGDEEVERV